MRFLEEDQAILTLLSKMMAVHEATDWIPNQTEARLMRLPDEIAGDLLTLLKSHSFRVLLEDGRTLSFQGIAESSLPLRIECRMTPRGLELVAHLPPDLIPVTSDCAYMLCGENMLQLDPDQRELLSFLLPRQQDLQVVMTYPLAATEQVVGEILRGRGRRTVQVVGENKVEKLTEQKLIKKNPI